MTLFRTSLFSIFLLLFVTAVMKGQDSNFENGAAQLPDFIPPSPTAYELGKYGQVPVGMFTGTPNISVPIYTYSGKSLSVPITLNYSSNGIKVDQMASWVGLGWSLNVGGVITRMVRDEPDELGDLFSPGDDLTKADFDNYDPVALQFLYDGQFEGVDTEPDLYMFNFMGHSGKFILGANHETLLVIPQQAVKIEMTRGAGYDVTFQVTTPDGIKYLFEDIEKTKIFTDGSCGRSIDLRFPKITSWFLSRIIHPNGEEILFTYEPENYIYHPAVTQSYTVFKRQTDYFCPNSPSCEPPSEPLKTCKDRHEIIGVRLSKISSNIPGAPEAIFTAGTVNPNTTVSNAGSSYLLDRIKVEFPTTSQVIEQIDLSYHITGNDRVFLESTTFMDTSKIFSFEYHNRDLLPARFSTSQDHWGYFNGKSNGGYYIPKIDHESFADRGGDKSPSGAHAGYGLLNKITYPTKGSNTFVYEPNTHWEFQYDPPRDISHPVYLSTVSGSGSKVEFRDFTVIHPMNTPLYPSRVHAGISLSRDSDCVDTPLHHITATITLYDITSGGSHIVFRKQVRLQDAPSIDDRVGLSAGRTYRLEISGSECMDVGAHIEYYERGILQTKNIETGGVRIKSIETHDNLSDSTQYTRYYYGQMDSPEVSSGDEGPKPYYIGEQVSLTICPDGDSGGISGSYYKCYYDVLQSGSKVPLFNTGNNNIYYQYVTISHGGDLFENGGEEHWYYVNRDTPGELIFGNDYIQEATWNNSGWSNGLEKRVRFFDSKKTLVKEVINEYKNDERAFASSYGYVIRKKHEPKPIQSPLTYLCQASDTSQYRVYNHCEINHGHLFSLLFNNHQSLPLNIGNLICKKGDADNNEWIIKHPCFGKNVGDVVTSTDAVENLLAIRYENRADWHYLESSTVIDYGLGNDNNVFKKIIKYYYDNERHLQLTSTETIDSRGDTLTSRFYYPDDIISVTSLPGGALSGSAYHAIEELKSTGEQFRVSETIQKDALKNNNMLTVQRTNYNEWGELILPQTIEAAKENDNLQIRVRYHKYDAYGNVLEVSQEGGAHTVYLWGYHYSLPIAKIENTTYGEVMNALGVSEEDISYLQEMTGDALEAELNVKLRQNTFLDGGRVTTYAYKRAIGLERVTDPSGITTYYDYDDFGRLRKTLDREKNILKLYEYKYQD